MKLTYRQELQIMFQESRRREVLQFVNSTLADVRRKEQLAAKNKQLEERKYIMNYITGQKLK
jgi:hypothetical protein